MAKKNKNSLLDMIVSEQLRVAFLFQYVIVLTLHAIRYALRNSITCCLSVRSVLCNHVYSVYRKSVHGDPGN